MLPNDHFDSSSTNEKKLRWLVGLACILILASSLLYGTGRLRPILSNLQAVLRELETAQQPSNPNTPELTMEERKELASRLAGSGCQNYPIPGEIMVELKDGYGGDPRVHQLEQAIRNAMSMPQYATDYGYGVYKFYVNEGDERRAIDILKTYSFVIKAEQPIFVCPPAGASLKVSNKVRSK